MTAIVVFSVGASIIAGPAGAGADDAGAVATVAISPARDDVASTQEKGSAPPSGARGSSSGAAASSSPTVRWKGRLEALRPQRPRDYFELAEEIADLASSPAEAALAERLFRLAGGLDPEGLGRSACLALADLASNPVDRDRLLIAATLLDRRGAASVEMNDADREATPEAVLALSEALSFYRRGIGQRVTKLLDQPGVAALLAAHASAIDGGPQRIREDAKFYRGQARPALRPEALASMLRLEIGLLAGRDRPWSSDLLLAANRPLPEVDPGRLESLLDIDIRHCVFRDGAWVAP
ncbi:MAG: hypothetical protein U0575_13085 [Phycisphaerales bacterium]